MQLRSNLERRNQIGRPGLSGCGRRRRSTAGGSVRGGAALGSSEFADSGPPGVNPTQAWVRAGQCTTRKPHEASDGFGEAYYGERDGGGGSLRRRTSPASGVLRGQGLQTIRLNAKRTGEGCGFSPGASGGRRRRADGSSARFGGGIGAVAVAWSQACSSGRLGPAGRRASAL